MDVLFYHMTESRLEQALPQLVERCLSRDWRVLVQVGDEAQVTILDEALWTWRDDSFLPHGAEGIAKHDASAHPVWLAGGCEASAGRHVHFAVAGAVPEGSTVSERIIYMFDGHDADAVSTARERWKVEKEAGRPLTYWQQDGGRWVERASANKA
ncbi:MAG: DNA polymerase III subunit chi [Pseudomonadota bacterium]